MLKQLLTSVSNSVVNSGGYLPRRFGLGLGLGFRVRISWAAHGVGRVNARFPV